MPELIPLSGKQMPLFLAPPTFKGVFCIGVGERFLFQHHRNFLSACRFIDEQIIVAGWNVIVRCESFHFVEQFLLIGEVSANTHVRGSRQ